MIEYIGVLARDSGISQALRNLSWTDIGPVHGLGALVVVLLLWALVKK